MRINGVIPCFEFFGSEYKVLVTYRAIVDAFSVYASQPHLKPIYVNVCIVEKLPCINYVCTISS